MDEMANLENAIVRDNSKSRAAVNLIYTGKFKESADEHVSGSISRQNSIERPRGGDDGGHNTIRDSYNDVPEEQLAM